jgi:hypothetical protein
VAFGQAPELSENQTIHLELRATMMTESRIIGLNLDIFPISSPRPARCFSGKSTESQLATHLLREGQLLRSSEFLGNSFRSRPI